MRSFTWVGLLIALFLGVSSSSIALMSAGDEAKTLLDQVAAGEIEAVTAKLDPSIASPEEMKKGINGIMDQLGPQPGERKYSTTQVGVTKNTDGTSTDWGVLTVDQGDKSFVLRYEILEKDGKRLFRTFRVERVSDELKALSKFEMGGRSLVQYLFFGLGVLSLVFCLQTARLAFRNEKKRRWLWILLCLVGLGEVRFVWAPAPLLSLPIPQAWSIFRVTFFGFGFMRAGTYAPFFLSLGLPLGPLLYRWRLKRRPAEVVAPGVAE